ncbi:hypothetical protein [Bacillus sp. T33-2]|uniref:hypothetical protein n=1 Tax=Bacillus sp. T33-2 TaxID=2054168 RepID=UPI000C780107|nr:hypothetical protein [Bacillus sp. T33-2]PLR96090.1 hypothetical protein CVD19_12325 [Bacillus sp. T33-2]
MKVKRILQNRVTFIYLCIQLAGLSFLPFINVSGAASYDAGGFIIEADKVVGENMKASIVSTETSGSTARPMVRFTYDSARIYGLRLTKHLQTPGGRVSITMKANGPVRIKGMTVDTSAVSFKGACVHAIQVVPDAAMEDVTMVAHYMNAADSSLDKLQMQTVNGDAGVQKPGTLKILQDLSAMPLEQMQQEIKRISEGQLPLTCDAEPGESGDGAAVPVADEMKDGLEEIKNPVAVVTNPVDGVPVPVPDVVGNLPLPAVPPGLTIPNVPVPNVPGLPIPNVPDPNDIIGKTPLEPVIEAGKGIVDEVKDNVVVPVLEEVQDKTQPIRDAVKPVVEPVVEPVKQTAKTTCEKLTDANGQITKELGLELVDKALNENKALEDVCASNTTLKDQLKKWKEGFLGKLGLLPLLGPQLSERDKLVKLREAILREQDGAIITFK